MLLHLPIAIMATLSPVAVSDTVPKFDVARECRFEAGSTVELDRCSQDEAAALEQLKANWTLFTGVDKSSCLSVATVAGFASYVELLTCLEMAREANNTDKKSAQSEKDRSDAASRPRRNCRRRTRSDLAGTNAGPRQSLDCRYGDASPLRRNAVNVRVKPRTTVVERNLPFECIALVLQGGGALGAYQAGVYEAPAEAGIQPD